MIVAYFALYRVPEDSVTGLSSASVYNVEQNNDTGAVEATGKILEKDLKPRNMKGDMTEPLCQYDLNTYPSKSKVVVYDRSVSPMQNKR